MSNSRLSKGKAKEDNPAGSVYYSFNHVIFDWTKSLSSGPQYKGRSDDLLTLKNHLDTRNLFPKEAKNDVKNQSQVKSLLLTLNLLEKEEENKLGIELLIGSFQDSRMKLLLSSTFVESFVQQLYQTGQTSKVLPLPCSISQLADLLSIKRCFVSTEKDLS